MEIADIICGILIAAPIVVNVITLSELLTVKRLMNEHFAVQNKALEAIMESQIVIHKGISTTNTTLMEKRK